MSLAPFCAFWRILSPAGEGLLLEGRLGWPGVSILLEGGNDHGSSRKCPSAVQ